MDQLPTQPNYQRLSDALLTASQECARIPNVPAINNNQILVDLIGQLRDEMRQSVGQLRDEMRQSVGQLRDEMRQSAAQTTERLDSLQTSFVTMQADITIIRTDIDTIHSRFDASEGNTIARLFNSTINNPNSPFQPLHNRHNMPVQNFPGNGEALSRLNRTEVTNLLREFNLSIDGTVVDKKKRLTQFIGVVVQVV